MARVANMSMALFEGLMEYFREVYDLEEPGPMVARLLRGHDRRNVAFVVQHGRNLDKSSPARAALNLFAKDNIVDVALLNNICPLMAMTGSVRRSPPPSSTLTPIMSATCAGRIGGLPRSTTWSGAGVTARIYRRRSCPASGRWCGHRF
jgi:hypothetical protein